MTTRLFLIAICMVFFLPSCSRLKFLAVNVAASYTGDYTAHEDIAYGAEDGQALNIYTPNTQPENAPVLLFFYGGSWQSGDKNDYEFAAQPFADAGYTVVIPDYRKFPPHRYPVFMEDAAQALAWVTNNVAAYGGDASRIYIAGHSAGGHIALLLATDARYAEYAGTSLEAVKAVAGLSGAYDFVPQADDIKAVFKNADPVSSAMPTSYIDGTQPPVLALWGKQDKIVGVRNINRLQAAVDKAGGVLIIKRYAELDHAGTVAALSVQKRDSATVFADMLEFFKRYP